MQVSLSECRSIGESHEELIRYKAAIYCSQIIFIILGLLQITVIPPGIQGNLHSIPSTDLAPQR